MKTLGIVAALLLLIACFGLGVATVQSVERAALADAKCASVLTIAQHCDRALLTCQYWQARVSLDLQEVAAALNGQP